MNESTEESDYESDDRVMDPEVVKANATNVREKVGQLVKTGFVGIVNEMRKKTSAVIAQKWIEEVPTVSGEKNSEHLLKEDISEVLKDQAEGTKAISDNLKETKVLKSETKAQQEEIESTETNDIISKIIESPKKISTFTSILAKLNLKSATLAQSDTPPEQNDVPKTSITSHLPHLNRTKLSEFYEKFSINRDRYQLVKTRKMDIKNLLSKNETEEITEAIPTTTTDTDTVENTNETNVAHVKPEDEKHPIQFQFDESLVECSNSERVVAEVSVEKIEESESACATEGPTVSSASDDELLLLNESSSSNITFAPTITSSIDWSLKPSSNQNIRIGNIGRSVSDNPDKNGSKKYALVDIGRSFSLAHDDEAAAGVFVAINESNNSCPNPSSIHTSSSILSVANSSNNNLMLATSVPVSPVKFAGGSSEDEKRETSISEQLKNKKLLIRDSSFQSDSSHCSSVESLLEARRRDPEEILINLGFGPPRTEDILAKIPKRFLKPSQVRGVDTDEFLKKQHIAKHLHETSVLGYRGLIGNPDVAPSHIVAKIMERFQINDKSRLVHDLISQSNQKNQDHRPKSAPPTQTTFSPNLLFSSGLHQIEYPSE